jgi:hypothetical protein
MKQTYLYMWYPLFRAQWDRCNQRNHQSLNLKDSKYMLYTMDNETMTFHGCNVNALTVQLVLLPLNIDTIMIIFYAHK